MAHKEIGHIPQTSLMPDHPLWTPPGGQPGRYSEPSPVVKPQSVLPPDAAPHGREQAKPRPKIEKRRPKVAAIPGVPALDQLAGMKKAQRYGLALVRDTNDYLDGKIGWHDVNAGAYLYGPAGTGKTMFGASLANACGINFIATSYGNWQSVDGGHLGSTMAAMKKDFDRAKKLAPSILFIDEVDSIQTRDSDTSNGYQHAITNYLLKLLDDIKQHKGVIVIGACNYVGKLDSALTRSGRLGEAIEVTLPSIDELPAIIRFHLRAGELATDDLSSIALLCQGMSGADIQKLVADARRLARHNRQTFVGQHLLAILGEKSQQLPSRLRERIAVHEAGHAVVAVYLRAMERVTVSILGRGAGAGFMHAQSITQCPTRATIEKTLTVLLAGRAAEELVLGEPSATYGGDGKSDHALATKLALRAVTNLGLSDQGLSPWVDSDKESGLNRYPQEIVSEVKRMLETAQAAATDILRTRSTWHLAVAEALLDRHSLDHDAILSLKPPPPNLFDGHYKIPRRRT